MTPSKAQNIVLGAGYLFFDEEDAAGALTGERYIGDTPGFTINIASEKLEIDDSDEAVAQTLISLTKKVVRSGSVTVRDIDGDNLAAFIMGAFATHVQSAATAVTENLVVKKDRYYQLGASTTNPTGVRAVSNFVLKNQAGNVTYVAGTDYVLDAELGRVQVLKAGAIADASTVGATYDVAAVTRDSIITNGAGPRKGALRHVADNTHGANRDTYIPRLELSPNGDLALKSRDNIQEMAFDLNVLRRDGYEQLYVDGRAVA